jgi:hypothetical protein
MEDIVQRIKFINKKGGEPVPLESFQVIDGEICLDGVRVSRKNTHKICYECPSCNKENIIHFPLFIRKVQKDALTCKHCQGYVSVEEECNDEFKFEYYKRQLTLDEFERIRHLVVSFQNDKFTDMSLFEYKPIIKVGNQNKYVPQLYDIKRDVYEEIRNIVFKCERCQNEFVSQELSLQKNRFKIWCRNCTVPKKELKIHSMKNCNNDIVYYRNAHELKFLVAFRNTGIPIVNDVNVPFCFRVDGYTRLIEIRHKKKFREQNSDHYIIYSKTMDTQIRILSNILHDIQS